MIVGELPPFNGKIIVVYTLIGELNVYRVDRNNFYNSSKPATVVIERTGNGEKTTKNLTSGKTLIE